MPKIKKWYPPKESIELKESTFADDYFADEEFYEDNIIDSSYLGSEKLKEQVKEIFGDEKLF